MARTAADDIIDKERIVTMQLYADDPGDWWPYKRGKKGDQHQHRRPKQTTRDGPPLTHSLESAKEITETPATPHGPLTPNTDCRPPMESTREQEEGFRKRRLPFLAKDYDLNCIGKLETSYHLE